MPTHAKELFPTLATSISNNLYSVTGSRER